MVKKKCLNIIIIQYKNLHYKFSLPHFIQHTKDGGYIVGGTAYSADEKIEMFMIKINPHGKSEWKKTYRGLSDFEIFSILQTKDNGYIVAGKVARLGDEITNVLLLNLDSDGVIDQCDLRSDVEIKEMDYFLIKKSL